MDVLHTALAHTMLSAQQGGQLNMHEGQASWITPIFPATRDVDIKMIIVQGQLGQKLARPPHSLPISTNKPGMVAQLQSQSQGSIGRRIMVQSQTSAKVQVLT
jgi:hypothetical protein